MIHFRKMLDASEFAEEVETLLCFLGQCCSVVSPGEVLCDVYTQELGAAQKNSFSLITHKHSFFQKHKHVHSCFSHIIEAQFVLNTVLSDFSH